MNNKHKAFIGLLDQLATASEMPELMEAVKEGYRACMLEAADCNKEPIPEEVRNRVEGVANRFGVALKYSDDVGDGNVGYQLSYVTASNAAGPDDVDEDMITAIMKHLNFEVIREYDSEPSNDMDQTERRVVSYSYVPTQERNCDWSGMCEDFDRNYGL